jgi:hypothetical protein
MNALGGNLETLCRETAPEKLAYRRRTARHLGLESPVFHGVHFGIIEHDLESLKTAFTHRALSSSDKAILILFLGDTVIELLPY